MFRLRSAALLAGVLCIAACRIEDRTPTGSRRDDDAIHALLTTYYQSLAEKDWATSRSLFWDSATVELRRSDADSSWHDFRTADAYHHYLSRTYAAASSSVLGVRMFRVDVRQQGDLASAWVITRRRPGAGEGRNEVGTADNLMLRRQQGAWRIIDLASAPDASPVSR
jgi:SnoaL-like protein